MAGDLILPGGQPARPEKRKRVPISIAMLIPVTAAGVGQVTVQDASGTIYELGEGTWRIVSNEAYERFAEIAKGQEEMLASETPLSRRERRAKMRADSRN